jgi:glycolate oxidase iron-sulfur subunit
MAERLGELMPGTILTTAGGCGAYLAHVLGRERVVELSEYLVRMWSDGDPHPAAGSLRPLTVDGRPARAAVQDSCHLRNGMGVTAQPRDLISRVTEYVELPSAGTCCGAAGTYALLRPRESRAILDAKVDEIEAAGLDYLVVVNPGCQRQMLDGLRRRRSSVRVLHLAELLASALARSGAVS